MGINTKTRTRQATEEMKSAMLEWGEAATYARLGSEGAAEHHRIASDIHGRMAESLLTPPEQLPAIAHNEVIPEPEGNDSASVWLARDTMRNPDGPAIDASCRRINLLSGGGHDVTGMAIDAGNAIKPRNPLEKMLVHQAAMAHEMAMRLGGKALEDIDPVESARYANASARLMGMYQQSLLTLQRLRTGGSQTVTVQHVTVQGQAVIGNVQAGRGVLPEGEQ